MRRIKQFRYYSDGSINNSGLDNKNQDADKSIYRKALVTGSIFNETTPIVQLGIQTLPGTQFYINGGTEPIIVGVTGIYELDLRDATQINSLSFSNISLETINNLATGYLIVDIIYETEED